MEKKLLKFLKDFQKTFSDKLNKTFKYPLSDINSIFQKKKIMLKNIDTEFLKVEMTSYFSCRN